VKRVVVRDLARGTETKLTLEGISATTPVWSPDSRRFACILAEEGNKASILMASADGLGARDKIDLPTGGSWMVCDWSPALNRLIAIPPSFQGVYSAHPDSINIAPRVMPALNQLMAQVRISPDGRWAAYATNAGGGPVQVYVQSLTGTPGRWQISTDNGFWPVWTKGGTELVYESRNGLMAVTIDTREGFHPGTPRALFPVSVPGTAQLHYWTCTPAGDRFFVLQAPRSAASGSVEVVTDFKSLVNR